MRSSCHELRAKSMVKTTACWRRRLLRLLINAPSRSRHPSKPQTQTPNPKPGQSVSGSLAWHLLFERFRRPSSIARWWPSYEHATIFLIPNPASTKKEKKKKHTHTHIKVMKTNGYTLSLTLDLANPTFQALKGFFLPEVAAPAFFFARSCAPHLFIDPSYPCRRTEARGGRICCGHRTGSWCQEKLACSRHACPWRRGCQRSCEVHGSLST